MYNIEKGSNLGNLNELGIPRITSISQIKAAAPMGFYQVKRQAT